MNYQINPAGLILMSFPPVTHDPVEFGGISYCSTGEMITPAGSPHVKAIEFRIPRLKVCPSVSHQIVGGKDASPLVIYAVKINDNVGGMTQIAIEAQTLDGKPAAGTHRCNIVAIDAPQSIDNFNALVARVAAIEARLSAPRQQGGHAMMNGLPNGGFSLKINVGWRPNKVDTSPLVQVELADDGFTLSSGIYAATDWTAYG